MNAVLSLYDELSCRFNSVATMFFLRIHTVDTDHPLTFGNAEFIPCGTKASSYRADRNSKFSERRGVIHLFRTIARSSLPNPSSRSTVLFFVAVPNSFSFDDFIRFCGFHVDHVAELLFIRNDGIEDRYSVLVQLVDQGSADGFHCSLNGKRFSPAEAELCHILFLLSVEYTESSEIAGTPPAGCTELPTCPVCLERLDPDTSGILSTLCDHSFQCPCMSKWNHLSCQVCRFCQQQDDKPTCSACGTKENLWVCVICGFVGCGRYKEGHAIMHWKDTQHCYSLDLRTQQIWDYVGDNYVHRLNQSKVDGKSGGMNAQCKPIEGDCGTCEFNEDSGIDEALFSSKVQAIMDEYNRLLTTQLDTQRRYYESQLTEMKSRRESLISEAVEKAMTDRMHDIQNKLETCSAEKDAVAEVNRKLIKEQDIWRKMVKEIEEREISLSKSRDDQIIDLKEQIRDLKVYIEAQKTLDDGIKGGTVLPVLPDPSSPANRRNKKALRRRK